MERTRSAVAAGDCQSTQTASCEIRSLLAEIPPVPTEAPDSARSPHFPSAIVNSDVSVVSTGPSTVTSTPATSQHITDQVVKLRRGFYVAPNMQLKEDLQVVREQKIHERLRNELKNGIDGGTWVEEFMYAGGKPYKLKATVIITCGDATTKKRVEKLHKNMKWLRAILKEKNIVFTAHIVSIQWGAVDNGSLSLADDSLIASVVRLPGNARTLCGSSIGSRQTSLGAPRLYTSGGLLAANGNLYILTTGHQFYRDSLGGQTLSPFDTDGETDSEKSDDLVETSQAPYIFDENESESEEADDYSDEVAETQNNGGTSNFIGYSIGTSASVAVSRDQESKSPVLEDVREFELTLDFLSRSFRPEVDARDTGEDWALLRLPPDCPHLLNQINGNDKKTDIPIDGALPDSQRAEGDALILTGESGHRTAYLHASPASLKIGHFTSTVRLLTLEAPLPPGTSGAWVVIGNKVAGHVVAIRQDAPFAYMQPISILIDDIKVSIGSEDVQIPSESALQRLLQQQTLSLQPMQVSSIKAHARPKVLRQENPSSTPPTYATNSMSVAKTPAFDVDLERGLGNQPTLPKRGHIFNRRQRRLKDDDKKSIDVTGATTRANEMAINAKPLISIHDVTQSKWIINPDEPESQKIFMTLEKNHLGIEAADSAGLFSWVHYERKPSSMLFEDFEAVLDKTPGLYDFELAAASKCLREVKMMRKTFPNGKYLGPMLHHTCINTEQIPHKVPIIANFMSIPIFAVLNDQDDDKDHTRNQPWGGLMPTTHLTNRPPATLTRHPTRSLMQYSNILVTDEKRDHQQAFSRLDAGVRFHQAFVQVPELWVLIINMYTIITCAPFSVDDLHGDQIVFRNLVLRDSGKDQKILQEPALLPERCIIVKFTSLSGIFHDFTCRTWYGLVDTIARIEPEEIDLQMMLNDSDSGMMLIDDNFRQINRRRWLTLTTESPDQATVVSLRLIRNDVVNPLSIAFAERKRRVEEYIELTLQALKVSLAHHVERLKHQISSGAEERKISETKSQIRKIHTGIRAKTRWRVKNRLLLYASRWHLLFARSPTHALGHFVRELEHIHRLQSVHSHEQLLTPASRATYSRSKATESLSPSTLEAPWFFMEKERHKPPSRTVGTAKGSELILGPGKFPSGIDFLAATHQLPFGLGENLWKRRGNGDAPKTFSEGESYSVGDKLRETEIARSELSSLEKKGHSRLPGSFPVRPGLKRHQSQELLTRSSGKITPILTSSTSDFEGMTHHADEEGDFCIYVGAFPCRYHDLENPVDSSLDAPCTRGTYRIFDSWWLRKELDNVEEKSMSDVAASIDLLHPHEEGDSISDVSEVCDQKHQLIDTLNSLLACFVKQDRHDYCGVAKIWGILYRAWFMPPVRGLRTLLPVLSFLNKALASFDANCREILMSVEFGNLEADAESFLLLRSAFRTIFLDIVRFLLIALWAMREFGDIDTYLYHVWDKVNDSLRKCDRILLSRKTKTELGVESIRTADTMIGLLLDNALSMSCSDFTPARTGRSAKFDLENIYREYTSLLHQRARHDISAKTYEDVRLLREEIDTVIQVLHDQRDVFQKMVKLRESPKQILDHRLNAKIEKHLEEMTMRFQTLSKYAEQAEIWTANSARFLIEDNNKAIYVFTTVTVVFLPLSFVSGVFGMNTSDIRTTTHTQGFFWGIAVPFTVVILVLCLMILRSKSITRLRRKIWKFIVRIFPTAWRQESGIQKRRS